MRKYQFDDFKQDNAWLIFRVDAFVADEVVDIYVVMDLPSGMLLSYEATVAELSRSQVDSLIEKASFKALKVPRRILLAKNDPVELFLQEAVENLQVKIETAPAASFEDLTKQAKASFTNSVRESDLSSTFEQDDSDESEYECAKRSLPDSYDFCSCGSGLKYKFCCKRIFTQIVEAMVAAEDGKYKEALEWIAKARRLVGETSEVLCREAIVYSFFDMEKSDVLLKKSSELNPKHPRVHYIQALALVDQGDLQGAIQAYERAISYYPATDFYHLNEVHNNLAGVYYRMGNYKKAKSEWELALKFSPTDKMTQQNLLMATIHAGV